jgi:hypothetical protein
MVPTTPTHVPSACEGACANCGAALAGEYCHACGQKRLPVDDLTVRHFVSHAVEEVAQLDSKTLRSVRGLFRPGYLTSEYVAGHRQPYLTPLKLYLVCAAVFFLAAPYTGFNFEMLNQGDANNPARAMVERRILASGLDREHFIDRFDIRFQTVYTVGLSVSMMSAALLLSLLYRKRRIRYGVHQVFALHWMAFLHLGTIFAIAVVLLLGSPRWTVLPIGYLLFGPYLSLALKRVYGDRTLPAIARTIAILAVALVLDTLLVVLIVVITLALI